MTNSLRKLAKDLKAFAKRCKDFKYTEKALFVFLLCGIAGFADVATTTDQAIQNKRQEISTSIGDIRQEFKKVKTENNKLVKNYNLELIQLMEQGDHVVKSPWSSWQYGMNYFYNDWTGTYKGRGDKTPNVKYKRNSADKFGTYTGGKYGNTTLNKKVIEPISAVPVDAAVKPKIPTIKTVGSAEAPTIVTPTLNIQVSAVNPSSTKVPSIKQPKVELPSIHMDDVDGFTLAFPSSDYFLSHHPVHVNGTYDLTDHLPTIKGSATSDASYVAYEYFAHTDGIKSTNLNPVAIMRGDVSGSSLMTNLSGHFYGGGSRYAFVDDVRNYTGGVPDGAGHGQTPTSQVKFTLRNEATIGLEGPAIAGILNEETDWTEGKTTTNITNMGSINDENEFVLPNPSRSDGKYVGTAIHTASGAGGTYTLEVGPNTKGKMGYKVGMTQTVEETIDWRSGTNYEFFNGADDLNGSFIGFSNFDSTLNTAIEGNSNLTSLGTKGKKTKIGGLTDFEQDGVIHFNGDYSTGIQIASENRPAQSGSWPVGTPSTWSDQDSRSLVKATNKSNGYIQLDGAYSYGMKLAGTALHIDNRDYKDPNSKVSYLANEGLILISGSYDTGHHGSSAGIAKLKEAKWSSEKTLFNNGRIYVGGINNSGILLESIFNDTVTNKTDGVITIDKVYNLFNNPDSNVKYSNAVAQNNAGIRVQSYKPESATDKALGNPEGKNEGTINIKNGTNNVGIYVWDKNNVGTITDAVGKQLLGTNTGTININGTSNVGMMAQDDYGSTINFKTIIRNTGGINVSGSGSVGMFTANKDSFAEQNGGTITAYSGNLGVINKGVFNFNGGTITANGASAVGVYSANGTDSTTTIGNGTPGSTKLKVKNGGVGLYADDDSTQTLKEMDAEVEGSDEAGSILFYNLPSQLGGNKGKFDVSTNPGKAKIGNHSFAFYTTNNIFTSTTAFAQFLNDWENTGSGTGLALRMDTGSSLLLTDVSNSGTNNTIKFSDIVPPITGSTLKNAAPTGDQTVATISGVPDYYYVTLKGADVKVNESNYDLSNINNKLNRVSIYDSDITVDSSTTIQDGTTPNVENSTNLVRQKYILGVNNGKTLTNNGTITLNSTSLASNELKVLVAKSISCNG